MTPAEEIFDRIAAALERQATAQERAADELEKVATLFDLVTDPPEADEDSDPICFNVRSVDSE